MGDARLNRCNPKQTPVKLMDIAPGSKVNVKVVKHPTSQSARKTLVRLLSKDAEHKAEQKLMAKTRAKHYSPRRRGGRLYGGQMRKIMRVHGEMGESGTIVATMDVLRDLISVSRFVEVSAA